MRKKKEEVIVVIIVDYITSRIKSLVVELKIITLRIEGLDFDRIM
jgi:hypothetical protein